jgi:long-subunit fatty acid transport protein
MKLTARAGMVLLSLLTGTLLAAGQNSKRGTTAAPFLEFGVGSRAVAMGRAFTAVANDASTIYWNAAGMDRLNGNEVTFNYMNWIADMDFIYAGLVVKTKSAGAFGISLTSLSTPEMLVRTVDQPEGLGSRFDAADIAIGVSYANNLTDRFSFGGTFKYIQQRIWHMASDAVAMDFGILYSMPFEGARLGISISNFGTKLHLQGSDAMVFTDIDPTKEGNNTAVMAQLRTKEWALPLIFRFGVAYDVFESENHAVTIASDYVHPNNNNECVNLGLEYGFNNLLMVRIGYQSLFIQDSEEGLSFGMGLQYRGIGVDYAYIKLQHLGYAQQFSAKLEF